MSSTRKIIIMNAEGWPGIERGAALLTSDMHPLDVVEQAISLSEAEPQVRTVGFGGAPNALGIMELDASIMNGDTLETASVGALRDVLHPISVARKLLETLPHVMLVGEGALLFAKEMGYATQNILSPEAEQDYVSWRQKNKFQKVKDLFPPDSQRGSHGTVITLAANGHGSFAGGVSTSGWDYKYPGRLGDSPIIGAGLYVDSSYGAAACTHCGENAIRTCLARSVVAYLKCGRPLEDAVREGMHDLSRLKGGIQGQVVLYAIDAAGNFLVAQRFREPIGEYYVFTEGMDKPERRQAICFSN